MRDRGTRLESYIRKTMTTRLDRQWQAWSYEAQALMDERNDDWQREYQLFDAPYRWSLQPPELIFERGPDEVVADLCLVGTYAPADRFFLWAWGNTSIDREVREGLEAVRRFGAARGWSQLTEPRVSGEEELAERLAAVAARIQDAAGTFVDVSDDLTLAFTIRGFRVRPRAGP